MLDYQGSQRGSASISIDLKLEMCQGETMLRGECSEAEHIVMYLKHAWRFAAGNFYLGSQGHDWIAVD